MLTVVHCALAHVIEILSRIHQLSSSPIERCLFGAVEVVELLKRSEHLHCFVSTRSTTLHAYINTCSTQSVTELESL